MVKLNGKVWNTCLQIKKSNTNSFIKVYPRCTEKCNLTATSTDEQKQIILFLELIIAGNKPTEASKND